MRQATGVTIIAIDAGVRAAAEAYWPCAADRVAAATIVIGELDGDRLATAVGNTITVDPDAAGRGWYVGTGAPNTTDTVDIGTPESPNVVPIDSGVDLLTVLAHEFGHVLGLPDLSDGTLMDGEIGNEIRRSTALCPWTIALDGDATLTTSMAGDVTVDFTNPAVPSATFASSSLRDITVIGDIRDDTLTVVGDPGVPLTFFGGPAVTGDAIVGPDAPTKFELSGGSGLPFSGTADINVSNVESIAGGTESDTLVLPPIATAVEFDGADAGTIRNSSNGFLATFADVEVVDSVTNAAGGNGATIFSVASPSSIASLAMAAADRFVVDVTVSDDGGDPVVYSADIDLLTVGTATLAGTLEVRVSGSSGLTSISLLDPAMPYLSFGTAPTTNFATFRGLDLGGGAYVELSRDSTVGEVRSLAPEQLTSGLVPDFLDSAAAEAFFAYLGGESAAPSGVKLSFGVAGQAISGVATFSGSAGGPYTIGLQDVTARLGQIDAPILSVTSTAAVSLTLTPNTARTIALPNADNGNLVGAFSGEVASSLAGVQIDGTVNVFFDAALSGGSASPISFTATGVAVAVNGQSITGSGTISVERLSTAGIAELSLTGLAGRVVTLGADGATVTSTLLRTDRSTAFDIESISLDTAASATRVNVMTFGDHGFNVGRLITVSGTSNAEFDGDHLIASVVSAKEFTVELPAPGTTATVTGAGVISTTEVYDPTLVLSAAGVRLSSVDRDTGAETATEATVAVSTTGLTIGSSVDVASMTRTNGAVTVTTDGAHRLTVGRSVIVSGAGALNGTHAVYAVLGTDQFSFLQRGADDAGPSAGAVVTIPFTVALDTTAAPRTFRLGATAATVTSGVASFTADVSIVQRVGADGQAVLTVAVADLDAALFAGVDRVVSVSDGAGAFVVTGDGIAGSASGTGSFGIADLGIASGAVRVDVNTTGVNIDESVAIGPSILPIRAEAGDYLRVLVTDASAAISYDADTDLTISGNLLFERSGARTVLGVSDLAVSLASTTLDDAELFGGEGAFIVSAAGLAGVVSGRATTSFGDVAIGGRVGIRLNTTGAVVASTMVNVAGRQFTIEFTEADVLEVFGSINTFDLAGFVTIDGGVDFGVASGGSVTIQSGTVLFVGEGPASTPSGAPNPSARGLRFTATASGSLTRDGSGSTAKYLLAIIGDLALVGIGGVTGTAAASTLRVDTRTGQPEKLEVETGALSLTVDGLAVSATSAFFGRHTTAAGEDALAATLAGVAFSMQANSTELVGITAGTGAVLFTSRGAVAQLSGTATIDGTPFGAEIEMNSTGRAVNENVAGVLLDVEAGEFVRVAVTVAAGDELTIGSLALYGDYVFELGNDSVLVSVSRGGFDFGDFTVTGVDASLSWNGSSFTGSLIGDAAFTATTPDVTIKGSFDVTLGTTLSVVATGVTLEFDEVVFTGDLEFDGSDSFAIENGSALVGIVRITEIEGDLTLNSTGSTGLNGSLSGTVGINAPGSLVLDASAMITFNQSGTPAGPEFAVRLDVRDFVVGDVVFLSGADPPAVIDISQNSDGSTTVAVTSLPISFDGFGADVTGDILISDDGYAGSLTVANLATSLGTLGSFAATGAVLELNSFPSPLTAPALSAGPYVRLALTGVTVDVTVGTVTYDASFDAAVDYSVAPDGMSTTTFGVTDFTLMLGVDQLITNGRGALIVAGNGVAGVISGTATAAGATVTATVRFNSTGVRVNRAVVVGGATINIDVQPGEVTVIAANAVIDIGGFVMIEGSFQTTSIGNGRSVIGAVGARIVLGSGPYLALTNARLGLVLDDTGAGGTTYALSATGDLVLSGVGGVTLAGTATITFNNTGAAVSRVISFGTDSVTVDVADATASFSAASVTASLAGQRLVGSASFTETVGGDLEITFSDVDVRLGGGVATVNGASGSLLVTDTGVSGNVSVTPGVGGPPAITFAPSAAVSVSVATALVNVDTTLTTPLFAVVLNGAVVSVAGATITADLTIVSTGGRLGIEVSAGSFTLGSGAATATASNVSGRWFVDAAGVAGTMSAATVVATAPGLTDLVGSWTVSLSTRPTPTDEAVTVGGATVAVVVPAGPYLRVEATGARIETSGIVVDANVVMQDSAGIVALAISNAGLSLGGGVAKIENGSGVVAFTDIGIVARATGTFVTTLPGVTVSGTASIAINTATTQQSVVVSVGGASLGATVAGSTVGVSISGAVLRVAGVRLTADELTLRQSGGFVVASGSNVGAAIFAGTRRVVGVSGADFALGTSATGVAFALRNGTVVGPDLGGDLTLSAASIAIDVSTSTTEIDLTVPNVTGLVTPAAATLDASSVVVPSVSVTATTVAIGFLGVAAAAASLSFSVVGSTVDVTGTGVNLSLSTGGSVVAGVQNASLKLRITDAGIAVVVADATLVVPTVAGMTLSGSITVEVNTVGANQRLSVGGVTYRLTAAAPGGAYVRVTVRDAVVELPPGLRFTADLLAFERFGSTVTAAGSGVSLDISAGTGMSAVRILSIADAEFGIRFSPEGVTAAITDAAVAGPDVGYGLTFTADTASLLLNTVDADVSVEVDGAPVVVAAAVDGVAYVRVELGDAEITVADSTLTVAALVVEQDGDTVRASADDLAVQLSVDQGGTPVDIIGISGADLGVTFTAAGVAGVARDGVVSENIDGVTVSGTVGMSFNTATGPIGVQFVDDEGVVTETVIVPGSTSGPFLAIEVTDGALGLFGSEITADLFSFSSRRHERRRGRHRARPRARCGWPAGRRDRRCHRRLRDQRRRCGGCRRRR